MAFGWMISKIAMEHVVQVYSVLPTVGRPMVWLAIIQSDSTYLVLTYACIFLKLRINEENCQFTSNEKHSCKWDTKTDQTVSSEATTMCEKLLKDPRFEPCRKVLFVPN